MNSNAKTGNCESAESFDKSRIFGISINRSIVNKPSAADFGSNFYRVEVTIEELATAIKKGFAWSCSVYQNGKRKKENFIQAQFIGVDIDDGITLEEGLNHPFYRKHGVLAHTSIHHQKEKNGKVCDRFRLVFSLSQPVTDIILYERALRWVMGQFSKVDESCKDSSRYWAGNTDATIYTNEGELIPIEIIPSEEVTNRSTSKTTKRTTGNFNNRQFPDGLLNYGGAIPLEICLSKANRELLENGCGEGARNTSAHKLACDLLGVDEYITKKYKSESDPRLLFDRFCDRCSPSLEQGERDRVWESARKSNPVPAIVHELGEDALKNCINAYISKQRRESYGGKNNVINHPRLLSPSPEKFTEEIDKLIKKNYTGYDLKLALTTLANNSGRNCYEIEQLYKARLKTVEQSENKNEYREGLDAIKNAEDYRLDISSVLPEPTVQALKFFADYLSLRPEVLATALLTGISSVHHPETKYELIRATNYKVCANLYAAIVADSSQKKSPIIKEMVYKPLLELQKRAREKYQEDLREYNKDQMRYADLKKGKNAEALSEHFPDGEPQPPKKPIFYVTDATFEAIAKHFNDQKDQGLLYYIDELAGLFKSFNQYRGGRGKDEENLLSLYDGGGQIVLRKTSETTESVSTLLAILGTIQPETLKELMGDGRDSNGKWARFIFCFQPNQAATISGKTATIKFDLATLYQAVADKPQAIYEHSNEARELFEAEYDDAEIKRLSEINPALQHLYGKMPGLIGKIALNLHLIKHAYSETVPTQVSGETMTAAIKFAKFFFYQAKFLILKTDDSTDNVPAHLAKILDIAKKRGEVTWRDFRATLSKKQREATKAHFPAWIEQLEAMGYGEAVITPTTAKFILKNVGDEAQCGSIKKTTHTAESIYNKTSTHNVGNVGYVGQKNNVFSDSEETKTGDDENINIYIDQPTQPTSPTNEGETIGGREIENVGDTVGQDVGGTEVTHTEVSQNLLSGDPPTVGYVGERQFHTSGGDKDDEPVKWCPPGDFPTGCPYSYKERVYYGNDATPLFVIGAELRKNGQLYIWTQDRTGKMMTMPIPIGMLSIKQPDAG